MAKLVIANISADYGATASINTAFDDIETAFENTLSRDGTSPNAMSAEIDMGTNDLNNVKTITAQTVVANGQSLVPSSVVAIDTASSVPNVPAGNIAATDVQTAINELDAEKVGLAGTETITGDKTLSGTNIHSGINTFSNDNIHSGNNTISGDNAFTGANTHSNTEDFTGVIRGSVGTIVASATALPNTTDGNYAHVSGTTTITSIATTGKVGTIIQREFDGILTLTHHATNLRLFNDADIITAAGDVATLLEYATGDFKLINYTKAGGEAGVIQVVNTTDGEVATGTTPLPLDDTIPQNTEGDEYITRIITPTNAGNTLIIETVINISSTNSDNSMQIALFQDSVANALAATWAARDGTTTAECQVTLRHVMVAGSTSAITFKVRAGTSSAGTTTFNGQSSARIFGGVMSSSITITEVRA